MSKLTLMQKDGAGQMNVPPEKVDAYKLEGWIVIDRPPEPVRIMAEVIGPQLQSPAEVQSQESSVNVEEAVDKISRRSKKG